VSRPSIPWAWSERLAEEAVAVGVEAMEEVEAEEVEARVEVAEVAGVMAFPMS
jgi:hypothetical protein